MVYKNTIKGSFLNRPNRFIAEVDINGNSEICHVKNTGRCRELLTQNASVILEKSENPNRRTKYDLVAVYKNDKLINIDSQAPNKVFYEWIMDGNFLPDIKWVKPEYTYGKSRFDFFIETESAKVLVEVKGVTLEKDGIVLFPDAPTERGVRHINELIKSVKDGYTAYLVFIVQMEDVKCFVPNKITHPEFADALINAEKNGVNILALSCNVGENSLEILDDVKIDLYGKCE